MGIITLKIPYPGETNFPAGQRHGVAVGVHGDETHIGDPAAATVLVLGLHAEGWQCLVLAVQLHHHVRARAHHVVATAVEGSVMGVTLGSADGHGAWHALGVPIHHLAGLRRRALHTFAGGLLHRQSGWGGRRGGEGEVRKCAHGWESWSNPAAGSLDNVLTTTHFRSGETEVWNLTGRELLRPNPSPGSLIPQFNTAQPRRTGR